MGTPLTLPPPLCMQPCRDDKKASHWAYYLITYNLPPHIRQKLGPATVLCIMPSTAEDGSNIDPGYALEIIIDQLLVMYNPGFPVLDASTGEIILIRAKLFTLASDYRGLQKVLKLKGSPALYACFFCWLKGFKLAAAPVQAARGTKARRGGCSTAAALPDAGAGAVAAPARGGKVIEPGVDCQTSSAPPS